MGLSFAYERRIWNIGAEWQWIAGSLCASLVLALCLAGAVAPVAATERIFADGFEPCCSLGGEVSSLTGTGLVVRLAAGAISEDKSIAANGGELRLYTFTHTAPPGIAYAVTITTQPSGQICTLTNASGTMTSTPMDNINATCVTGPASLNWAGGNWNDANWQ